MLISHASNTRQLFQLLFLQRITAEVQEITYPLLMQRSADADLCACFVSSEFLCSFSLVTHLRVVSPT